MPIPSATNSSPPSGPYGARALPSDLSKATSTRASLNEYIPAKADISHSHTQLAANVRVGSETLMKEHSHPFLLSQARVVYSSHLDQRIRECTQEDQQRSRLIWATHALAHEAPLPY